MGGNKGSRFLEKTVYGAIVEVILLGQGDLRVKFFDGD